MIKPEQALTDIPKGLRKPLLKEYNEIIQKYLERNWLDSSLRGGRFCEVVFTIIEGYGSKNYARAPKKPANFVSACRKLESNKSVPRSLQILIPRLLPALYEIRNNRDVGHVGGDVDSNHMDATVVVSMSSWIMAELVRVLHDLSISEAQQIVDSLIERRTPLVWNSGEIKRILNPKLSIRDQILLLLSSSATKISIDDLYKWLDYNNRSYFNKTLRELHKKRFLEFNEHKGEIEILPPGSEYVANLYASAQEGENDGSDQAL